MRRKRRRKTIRELILLSFLKAVSTETKYQAFATLTFQPFSLDNETDNDDDDYDDDQNTSDNTARNGCCGHGVVR